MVNRGSLELIQTTFHKHDQEIQVRLAFLTFTFLSPQLLVGYFNENEAFFLCFSFLKPIQTQRERYLAI